MNGILEKLIEASRTRMDEYDPRRNLDLMFYTTELGGECGEFLNKCKKWFRALANLPGSVCTKQEILEEAADTIICTVNAVNKLGWGNQLGFIIKQKYNADSEKNGFITRID